MEEIEEKNLKKSPEIDLNLCCRFLGGFLLVTRKLAPVHLFHLLEPAPQQLSLACLN